VYITRILYTSKDSFAELENFRVVLFYCLVFSVTYTLALYALGFLYKFSLELLVAKKLGIADTLSVYFRANLCKYLPGNVMQFVARNLYAEKIGLSQAKMVFGSLLDVMMVTAVSIVLCLVFVNELFFTIVEDVFSINVYIIFFAVTFGLILIFFLIARKGHILNKIINEFKQSLDNVNVAKVLLYIGKSFGIISFMHTVAGLMFFYLLQTISSVTAVSVFIVISVYIAAWLLGFITPGSPGGVGVKEAVLLLVLSEFYGRENVVICVVLFRLVTITADILAFCSHTVIIKIFTRIHVNTNQTHSKIQGDQTL